MSRLGGKTYYSACFIKNTGVDARGWWYYYNVTYSYMLGRISANKAFPVDVQRLSNGRYNVVMHRRVGQVFWHYYGVTNSQAFNLLK